MIRRRYAPLLLAVLIAVLSGGVAAATNSPSVLFWNPPHDCRADAWHTYTSATSTFRFGTQEDGWDCTTVQVRGRYLIANPYGWVTSSIYTGSSSVTQTRTGVIGHDYSDHWACKGQCGYVRVY